MIYERAHAYSMALLSLIELAIALLVGISSGIFIGTWAGLKAARIFVLTVMADQRVEALVNLARTFGGKRRMKWEDLAVQAGQGFLSHMFGGGGQPVQIYQPPQPPQG